MSIDHVLFEVLADELHARKWVCQISDPENIRVWRSERVVGDDCSHDEEAKNAVIDEAFKKFHDDIIFEIE